MPNTTVSISAMDLRESPGVFLDRVDYRNESFIIERAGKQKAVLVPLSWYNAVEQARNRFFANTKLMQKAFANESPREVDKQIKNAISHLRH